MSIRRRDKRIRPTTLQGRGVTGSTADFGHRPAGSRVGRREVWVRFPPALFTLARSSAVRAASL